MWFFISSFDFMDLWFHCGFSLVSNWIVALFIVNFVLSWIYVSFYGLILVSNWNFTHSLTHLVFIPHSLMLPLIHHLLPLASITFIVDFEAKVRWSICVFLFWFSFYFLLFVNCFYFHNCDVTILLIFSMFFQFLFLSRMNVLQFHTCWSNYFSLLVDIKVFSLHA